MARAGEKAGLNRAVGSDHVTLLEAVFAIHRLPAWGTTLSARVNSAPKVHVFDTGLGGWLLRLAAEPLRRGDPTAWEQFGHLLESPERLGPASVSIRSGRSTSTSRARGPTPTEKKFDTLWARSGRSAASARRSRRSPSMATVCVDRRHCEHHEQPAGNKSVEPSAEGGKGARRPRQLSPRPATPS